MPPRYGKYVQHALINTAAVALPAYAILRGSRTADAQYKLYRELQQNREKDLSTPMPSLTVKQSYEKFAEEKLADDDGKPKAPSPLELGKLMNWNIRAGLADGIGKGVGTAIGKTFIETPVEAATKYLTKRFSTDPKQLKALNEAIEGDDVLGSSDRSKIDSAHSTLKRFSPSLAEDPNAVRSYLRTAVMSHGGVDLATIRMLLDAEKARQAGKGKFVMP